MGRSLDIRYIDYLRNSKNHIEELQSNPRVYEELMKHSFFHTKEERIFHFKKPHSRAYKIEKIRQSQKNNKLDDKIIQKDNEISTANELILQHTYRKYGILTAEHMATDLKDNSSSTENLGVISENYIGKDLEFTTLFSFFCMHNNVDIYKNMVNETYNSFSQRKVGSLEINSQALSIFGGIDRLEHLLDFELSYIQLLTPEVYDKLIINYLLSAFDFSDDDHLTNGYLVKKKNQDFFEKFYIFDKESTSFTLPIALGGNYKTVKKKAMAYNDYNSNMHISKEKENHTDRIQEILRLIRIGKLDKKYCDILKDISKIDYSALAGRLKQKYGVEADPIQIDMLKLGSEQAGLVLDKA